MPHHAVNGALYKAVRYRYNFTVIIPLKIEKKVELIKIFFCGLSIFFRSGCKLENCDGYVGDFSACQNT